MVGGFILATPDPVVGYAPVMSNRYPERFRTGSYSLLSLPRQVVQSPKLNRLLPSDFSWFRHRDAQGLYYIEQPASDGQDTIRRLDARTWQETGRWRLPLLSMPSLETSEAVREWYGIEIPATLPDGRLVVQISATVSPPTGPTPAVSRCGFCLLDPRQPSPTSPLPWSTIIEDLGVIWPAWAIDNTALLGVTARPMQGSRRVLLDLAAGAFNEVAPDDPRFTGIGQMPPKLLRDSAIGNFLQAQGGSPTHYVGGVIEELEIRGPGGLRIGMPVEHLLPTGTEPTSAYHAGALKAVRLTAAGPSRFSLSPVTRDLAPLAAPRMQQLPLAAFALNAQHLLLVQPVPPLSGATDPALQAGCLRIGTLRVADGAEDWIGTLPLPSQFAAAPRNVSVQVAHQGSDLLVTLVSMSMGRLDIPPPTDSGPYGTQL